MYAYYDEDEFETVIESRPCTSCGGDLGKCRGIGCNGMSGMTSRRRDPKQIAIIKAKREKEREDAVLAEAAFIMAKRGMK